MSEIAELFEFMRTCPQLENLYSIAGTEEIGARIILPQGSSQTYRYLEQIDVLHGYQCDMVPFESVFVDYQINCFQAYDPKDTTEPEYNANVLNYDEVQSVCDWVRAQNEARNLPEITGRKVVSIECLPFVPQIRYVNADEGIVAYFVTVRLRYVNDAAQIYVEYPS